MWRLWGMLLLGAGSVHAGDTVLSMYRAFGGAGSTQQEPRIIRDVQGQCNEQSHRLVRENVWRCEAGGKTFDPCFVNPAAAHPRAICPEAPWVSDAIAIIPGYPPDNSAHVPLDMSRALPWAVLLENGERCIAEDGLGAYGEQMLHYRCEHTSSLGSVIARCTKTWKILRVQGSEASQEAIRQVWF